MVDRRTFLHRLGVVATAPVLAAFIPDERTGLSVPDNKIEVAKEMPKPDAMLISSTLVPSNIVAGMEMTPPDAMIPIYVNGKRYLIHAWAG